MTQADEAHSTTPLAAPKAPGIYQIRNLRSGKRYIGSAINLFKRRVQHFADLRAGRHFNRHLQAAWLRDGETAFAFEVIERCERADTLIREQVFIDLHQAADRRFGYNSRPKAESNLGHTFSAETREKNRRAQTGRRQSPETIMARTGGQRGRKLPPEWCEAIRAAKTGVARPDIAAWAPEKFSRFSDNDLATIRAAYAGGSTMQMLATRYGCAVSTIHRAVKGVGPAYQPGGVQPRARGGRSKAA